MLIKLLREEKPDYIAAIFESREKTFRHETFADYKANRLEMPEDLPKQMPYIFRLCEAFNIPVINFPGYEADDVIGTLAKQVAEKKMQCGHRFQRQRHVPARSRSLRRLHATEFAGGETQRTCAADRVV